MKFCEAVREARLARGWTQVDLAERAGVHRMSVHNLERGRSVTMRIAEPVMKTLCMDMRGGHWGWVLQAEEGG